MDECQTSARRADGRLATLGDVDWFSARSNQEVSLCSMDPKLQVDSSGVSLRACMFVSCARAPSGETEVDCGTTARVADVGPGWPEGCCSTGIDPEVGLDFDCGGFEDSAAVFVRVDSVDESVGCVEYGVELEF